MILQGKGKERKNRRCKLQNNYIFFCSPSLFSFSTSQISSYSSSLLPFQSSCLFIYLLGFLGLSSFMGISFSTSRRRSNHFFQNPHHSSFISPYSSGLTPVPLPPPPYYNLPYPSHPYPLHNSHPIPMMPPPQPTHHCCCHSSDGGQVVSGFNGPVALGRVNCSHFQANQSNVWSGVRPSVDALQVQSPSYVENRVARKIRNDVNVHKDTIRIDVDENNPDSHLVSFTFDALVDGSITILYFAKEGFNCSFTPLYPEVHVPLRIPFQGGLCQKFRQPSGTGIDLGFFELDDLSKPSPGDVFPLVIFAEACAVPLPSDVLLDQPRSISSHAQITQAILDKNNAGLFQVKAINQILWVDGVRYELRDIYGIGNLSEARVDGHEPGKECVICMTEPKDTAVLPCRHMCMCGGCAKALQLQTNKCPICRQPIEELIEISVNRNAL